MILSLHSHVATLNIMSSLSLIILVNTQMHMDKTLYTSDREIDLTINIPKPYLIHDGSKCSTSKNTISSYFNSPHELLQIELALRVLLKEMR